MGRKGEDFGVGDGDLRSGEAARAELREGDDRFGFVGAQSEGVLARSGALEDSCEGGSLAISKGSRDKGVGKKYTLN